MGGGDNTVLAWPSGDQNSLPALDECVNPLGLSFFKCKTGCLIIHLFRKYLPNTHPALALLVFLLQEFTRGGEQRQDNQRRIRPLAWYLAHRKVFQ